MRKILNLLVLSFKCTKHRQPRTPPTKMKREDIMLEVAVAVIIKSQYKETPWLCCGSLWRKCLSVGQKYSVHSGPWLLWKQPFFHHDKMPSEQCFFNKKKKKKEGKKAE